MTSVLLVDASPARSAFRRAAIIAIASLVVAVGALLFVARPAGASIASPGTKPGLLASVMTCDPNFGSRGVFGDVKMSSSNGLAAQYVTARIAIRQVGTTTWFWGPWAPSAIARPTIVAQLAPSAATSPLAVRTNEFWEVQVQGAWYVNGAWVYAAGTAKQALPSTSNAATPFRQRSSSVYGETYWSPGCFS